MSALTPPRGSWRKAIAGLALATAAVLLGLLILQPQWIGMESGVSAQTAYLTGLGELKALQLADGSRITLGARTRLVVDYTARARTVHLLYGEAWFQDKDIPNRPFIVTAGGGRITAVGTAFVVNRDSDHVVVTVTAGIVDVSTSVSAPRSQHEFAAPPAPHLPVVRVMPGEAVTYGGGAIGPVVHASAPAATSWTHGRLVFDDVPLRYVVENVDRYWSRRITVSGPAGDLQFSGQIYEGGIEDWLRGLPQIFPVKTEQTGDSVTVILSSQPNTTAMKHGS